MRCVRLALVSRVIWCLLSISDEGVRGMKPLDTLRPASDKTEIDHSAAVGIHQGGRRPAQCRNCSANIADMQTMIAAITT